MGCQALQAMIWIQRDQEKDSKESIFSDTTRVLTFITMACRRQRAIQVPAFLLRAEFEETGATRFDLADDWAKSRYHPQL